MEDRSAVKEGVSYQLIGLSGCHKGKSWIISHTPLVLGRGRSCDIVLDDPIVSRRHCQVSEKDGEVLLEDLGSRNPVLINGEPVRQARLAPKDELAVGRDLFLVTTVRGAGSSPAPLEKTPSSDTFSIASTALLGIEDGLAALGRRGPIRTVQDLADLFRAVSAFSRASDMGELIGAMAGWVRQRFTPTGLWLAKARGEEFTFYGADSPGLSPPQEAPVEAMCRTLRERQALLLPGGRVRQASSPPGAPSQAEDLGCTFVAPVTVADQNIGVVALTTAAPQDHAAESSLQLLALVAQALGPFVHAVASIEQLRRDNERLRMRSGESLTLVGDSSDMRRLRKDISTAARSHLNVLITGETGTGKELVARLLHAESSRSSGPLIVVNCAAIPRDLFESQLFGYEKGAFTGATEASPGLMALAHGGTLFLDEIGDLSPDNQARILRAIESGLFRRIGAEQETRVDIRVVAATNKDIRAAINTGTFREDLYHRVAGFEIHIPPLREHSSDIPALAEHFFALGKHEAKRPLMGIAPEAMACLKERPWTGNVRELRSCVFRAIAVAQQEVLQPQDFLDYRPASVRPIEMQLTSLVEAEKRHIAAVLRRCEGNIKQAAELLEVGVSTLYKKLTKYGIRH